jgi:AcrR family transcriptional regulator
MEPERRVRVSPLRERGKQSVAKLLDSTAALLDEVGFEQLTTQLVAQRSEVSIGLVYHYFPDRLALVQALVARNFERFAAAVEEMLNQPGPLSRRQALDGTIDALVRLYRHEPGFARVGFADRFLAAQAPPAQGATPAPVPDAARRLTELIRGRFADWPDDPNLPLRLAIAVEIADAVVSRAFRIDPGGDQEIVGELRKILGPYLAPALEAG